MPGLKKVTNLTREERINLVERAESELPLTIQTDLLSVSRTNLYYQPRPPNAVEVQCKHRIDEIYTQSPFYGARKIAVQLQREGMGINRKTVGRYMREMGIAAIYPGPKPLVNETTRRECIRTYYVTSPARIRIIFGASISQTFAQRGRLDVSDSHS